MTIRKSLSTQDYIRIENSVTDIDQRECFLKVTESHYRPDVSNGLDLSFFSIERSFHFSIELPYSVFVQRTSSIPSDIKLQSVVLSISMSTISSQTLPQAKVRRLSSDSVLSAPNSRAETLESSEWAILFHILLSSKGGHISSSNGTELPPA